MSAAVRYRRPREHDFSRAVTTRLLLAERDTNPPWRDQRAMPLTTPPKGMSMNHGMHAFAQPEHPKAPDLTAPEDLVRAVKGLYEQEHLGRISADLAYLGAQTLAELLAILQEDRKFTAALGDRPGHESDAVKGAARDCEPVLQALQMPDPSRRAQRPYDLQVAQTTLSRLRLWTALVRARRLSRVADARRIEELLTDVALGRRSVADAELMAGVLRVWSQARTDVLGADGSDDE